MCLYLAVKEHLCHPDIGPYISYGIAGYRLFCPGVRLLCAVSDVSVRRTFVCCLALRCTLCQLDPIHLLDVVEDAL